jgi:hypothetical protein
MKLRYTPDVNAAAAYTESWNWSVIDLDFAIHQFIPALTAGVDPLTITVPYSLPVAGDMATVTFVVSTYTAPAPASGVTVVGGKVPDWNQPSYYHVMGKIPDPASAHQAWCTPAAAACQLGHLNMYFGFDDPKASNGFINGVNDQCDASFTKNPEMGDNTPVSTIAWDSGKGWGDYLIDSPTVRGILNYAYTEGSAHCETTDFGWYMNTNQIGRHGAGAGVTAGTTTQEGYLGLKEWYTVAGYTDLIGITYSPSYAPVGAPRHQGAMPDRWHSALAWDPAYYSGADPWDVEDMWTTLKWEIDLNLTVIACMQGWHVSPLNPTYPDGFGANGWPFNDPSAESTEYYKLNPESSSSGTLGEWYTNSNYDGNWADSLGHTVLIYGYIEAGSIEDISPKKDTNWIMVRDNDHTTVRGVIIPFNTLDPSGWTGLGPVRFAQDCVIAYIWNEFHRKVYAPATCPPTVVDPGLGSGPHFITGVALPSSTDFVTGMALPTSEDS